MYSGSSQSLIRLVWGKGVWPSVSSADRRNVVFTCLNVMKRHLLTFLICASVMVINRTSRAQNIVAVHDQGGRTVWGNNYDASKAEAPCSPQARPEAVTVLA